MARIVEALAQDSIMEGSTMNKNGSSVKCVGKLWLGQFSKYMI